jgi:zinc protease
MGAAIRHMLELRYVQSIREDEGGAYSVRTSYSLNNYPESGFFLNVSFDTDPLKADKLVGIVQREVTNLIDNGPLETDLQKAQEYFLKQRPEDLKENTFWSSLLFDYYFTGMDYLSGFENKVKTLNVKSVHDYARKILSGKNEVKVIMRPIP